MKRKLCYWIVGLKTDEPLWVADLFEGGKPVKWCGNGTNFEGKCNPRYPRTSAHKAVRKLAKEEHVSWANVTFDRDSTQDHERS